MFAGHSRWSVLAALLTVLIQPVPGTLAGQAAQTQAPAAQTAPPDLEAEGERAAPVLLGGEPILWVTTGVGPYTPQYRADRISQRVLDAVRDRSIRDPTVTVREIEGSSELRVGSRLLMVVTQRDAASVGASREGVAQHLAREMETAIRAERLRYAPATLVRSGIYGLAATLALVGVIYVVLRLTRMIRRGIERRYGGAPGSPHLPEADIASHNLGHAFDIVIRAVRLVLIVLAIDLHLTFVLGLFPWTRHVSRALLDYAMTPVRAIGVAFVGYLPKFVFLIVISTIIYTAIRLVGLFFNLIRHRRIVFARFPAEWADPTNNIVRILLVAFGLVVAFPYLPASDSPAFASVSVFIGVLISLSSTSALANMIAGVVMTYTGAFRLGDRVKLGEAFGDIVETSMLAIHVRTIKNEDITIPNSVVLSSSTINYSRSAETLGLILHTSVTIGYDAPWRKVHDLLIEAALATPGVLHEPRPFVWQTALNDFYVTYEINAYTNAPQDMIDIYAALHSEIQDAFYAAGVEIMSPHYTSLRDGNTVAIPEPFRTPGYQPPAFRVEQQPSGENEGRR
jgi:small-conductance mechanosensitive channel